MSGPDASRLGSLVHNRSRLLRRHRRQSRCNHPRPRPVVPGQSPAAGSRSWPLTVMVTALDGQTLPEPSSRLPVRSSARRSTDPSGLVTFANMAPGTYRLRFEHEGFVTLEKEVIIAAGKPLRASASLSAGPPPPAPPKPEPAPPAHRRPSNRTATTSRTSPFDIWIDSELHRQARRRSGRHRLHGQLDLDAAADRTNRSPSKRTATPTRPSTSSPAKALYGWTAAITR